MLHLLVVTPTLGESEFFTQTVDSVNRFRVLKDLNLTHVVVCPESKIREMALQAPSATILGEGPDCRSMYSAINMAVKSSDLPWTHFTYINDDDFLLPDFGLLLANLYHKKADFSYGLVDLVGDDGNLIYPIPIVRNPNHIIDLYSLGISPFTQQGTVVGRSLYEKLECFDDAFKYAGDMDFWCRACQMNPTYYFENKSVAAFRATGGQLSSHRTHFNSEINEIRSRLTKPSKLRSIHALCLFYGMNGLRYLRRILLTGFKRSYTYLNE
ncbi:MAG: hypothetical protein AAGH72_04520 [Verrucomicrobiota bacterium]